MIGGKYRVISLIGSGSFGEIFLATDTSQNNEQVAIKVEKSTAKCPQLDFESRVYKVLRGGVGIPNVYWFGRTEDKNLAMVMEPLGPSLESLFNTCGRQFSLKTVLMIADQLIERVGSFLYLTECRVYPFQVFCS
jgi:serine/threonine protein kinase